MKTSELKCEVCGAISVISTVRPVNPNNRRVFRNVYCTKCEWFRIIYVQEVKVCRK